MRLRYNTSSAWTQVVLSDLDAFLADHARCERKASALAMSLVAHYPDRPELVRKMVALAQEELKHFAQVYDLLEARAVDLGSDRKDPYVRQLLDHARKGQRPYFLDRLLIAGIVEARGCERFGLLAEALPEGELKAFYQQLTAAEARHHGLFVRLARCYFPAADVRQRLDELLEVEARVAQQLPLQPALH